MNAAMINTRCALQGVDFDVEDADEVYHIPDEDMPIPSCKGICRDDWCKKEVQLVHSTGVCVATAYVEFAKPWQSIDGRSPLGEEFVGVVVCEVLQAGASLETRTLRRWSTKFTLFEGVSLYNHERKFNEDIKMKAAKLGDRRGSRQYSSLRHAQPREMSRKDSLVQKQSIRQTLQTACCKRQCLSQFNHAMVETLRYEMHHSDSKSKDSMKLSVHRNFHCIPNTSKRVCVVEGKTVCMHAWRLIYGVSKTDFYRYRDYAATGRRPQHHGTLGKKKISSSTAQATQTMSMILSSTADAMPHRTHTKTSGIMKGKKVVEKVLPNGTKWKHILEEVNKVETVNKLCAEFGS